LGARVKVHEEINDMLKRKFGRVPDRWLFNYAHAKLQRVNREKYPLFFFGKLAFSSIYASLRWNRQVSENMATTLKQWIPIFKKIA